MIKYNAIMILDSCVTTTTTMHVRAAKALFYVIMHKVYCIQIPNGFSGKSLYHLSPGLTFFFFFFAKYPLQPSLQLTTPQEGAFSSFFFQSHRHI